MSDVRTLRLLLCTALLAAAVAASTVLAPEASAAKPCGELIVNDWYGNLRVDKIYPLPCYRQAIRTLPPDVRDYSEAEDDILRAEAYARVNKPDPGPSGGPAPSETEPPPAETTQPPPTETTQRPPTDTDPPVPPDTGPIDPGDPTSAEDTFDTSGPSSIPIPLFILGGLALLLLAAGAAGYLSRRAQARRPGGPPAT